MPIFRRLTRALFISASLIPGAVCFAAGPSYILQDPYEETPQASETLWEARGVLKSAQTAEISSTMSGRITSLPYDNGQSFKAGALLVRFDCTRIEAEIDALDHAEQALLSKYENAQALLSYGAAGELDVNLAKADYDKARADHRAAKARLSDCAIYAPYSGQVRQLYVNRYDTPGHNTPLLSIRKSGAIEISLITPSAWMRWMKDGQSFTFIVDETGETLEGKIVRFGAEVDPVSQTIEVIARFSGRSGRSLPGMSGIARFTPPEQDGQ